MTTTTPGPDRAMQAVLRRTFGGPEQLTLGEAERPELTDDGVLVRVTYSSLNRADWYAARGRPYLNRAKLGWRRPKSPLVGTDFAGVVHAVGSAVADFRIGDEVFGARSGSLAEFVNVRHAVALKPAKLTLEQAAAIPVAGVTALQALRDRGHVAAGQRVLVNGASGGVGTFAVQIAKAFGAHVTAVCSTRHIAVVRGLGADCVVDYTRDDFTRQAHRYDLVIDIAGSRSWRDLRRVLAPAATVVVVGGPARNRWIGPLAHALKMRIAGALSRRRVTFFVANVTRADLTTLAELAAIGALSPVVTRCFPATEIRDAMRMFDRGHVTGKLVIAL